MKTTAKRLAKSFLIVAVLLYSVSFFHAPSFGQPIIIDHTCTDITRIPEYWINQAKSQLRSCYGHTSHGSQPVTGMQGLMDADPMSHLYDFNTNGGIEPGVLSLDDYVPDGDLGHQGDTSWAVRTRLHLDGPGSDRNVVVWSWCGGVSDNTEAGINAYLSAMDLLERDYPDVTFVYMTGHLDGTGATGNLHIRNNQIRAYCAANSKVLFDFADIESYNPDGVCFLGLGADDACNYNGGLNNWAREWCASHPGSELCRDCGYVDCCAHSEPLNCHLKGRAFWWMMARIAGWPGPLVDLDIQANGSDGPVMVSSGAPVSIQVGLTPGGYAGFNADWWIAVHTPFAPPGDWYTYVHPTGWKPGVNLCAQTALFDVAPFEVLNRVLPVGNYTFYFAVDPPDGIPTAELVDSVAVEVTP